MSVSIIQGKRNSVEKDSSELASVVGCCWTITSVPFSAWFQELKDVISRLSEQLCALDLTAEDKEL